MSNSVWLMYSTMKINFGMHKSHNIFRPRHVLVQWAAMKKLWKVSIQYKKVLKRLSCESLVWPEFLQFSHFFSHPVQLYLSKLFWQVTQRDFTAKDHILYAHIKKRGKSIMMNRLKLARHEVNSHKITPNKTISVIPLRHAPLFKMSVVTLCEKRVCAGRAASGGDPATVLIPAWGTGSTLQACSPLPHVLPLRQPCFSSQSQTPSPIWFSVSATSH